MTNHANEVEVHVEYVQTEVHSSTVLKSLAMFFVQAIVEKERK